MNFNFQRLAYACALSTTMLSSSAIAASEGDQYIGLQYSSMTFENSGGVEWKPDAIVGRFGKYLSDSLSLEGRFGFGIGDDTATGFLPGFGIVDIELEMSTMFGIYGVGHHAINNNSSVYALIGISRGEADATITGAFNGSESDTETDLSFGVGANFGINNTTALNIEYISYISKSDFDVSGINFGFVSKF